MISVIVWMFIIFSIVSGLNKNSKNNLKNQKKNQKLDNFEDMLKSSDILKTIFGDEENLDDYEYNSESFSENKAGDEAGDEAETESKSELDIKNYPLERANFGELGGSMFGDNTDEHGCYGEAWSDSSGNYSEPINEGMHGQSGTQNVSTLSQYTGESLLDTRKTGFENEYTKTSGMSGYSGLDFPSSKESSLSIGQADDAYQVSDKRSSLSKIDKTRMREAVIMSEILKRPKCFRD